jgi:hypothetical protein
MKVPLDPDAVTRGYERETVEALEEARDHVDALFASAGRRF